VDYEVAPSRVAHAGRWRRSIAAAAVLGIAILAAAALGDSRAPSLTPSEQGVAVGSRASVATPAGPSGTPRAPWSIGDPAATLAPPRVVDCTTLARRPCDQAIIAARRVVWPLDGSPSSATVHASLICGSYRDCPRSLISSGTPLGSVVITFDDGRETWVNVIRPPLGPFGRHNEPVALVVRWVPPG
jgi:hypothetical protein